jgi:ADP-ribose pyrophosphatase
MPTIMERQVAFSTPWFDVVGKRVGSDPALYYALDSADYVGVLAVDTAGDLILVRQFRPAVESWTLEVPAGLLERGESPEACARREVLEETGYEGGQFECLGTLWPNVGRMSNHMWCFVATGLRPAAPPRVPESGIEIVRMPPSQFLDAMKDLQCEHALDFALVALAMVKCRFPRP